MKDFMKDFTRLFVIKNGGSNGWTNSDRSTFILSVDCQELKLTVRDGRDPFAAEINVAFALLLKEYVAENGTLERYERKNPYRFCFRQGSSGCQDTYMEEDFGDGFPKRRFLMHESCFGKCGGFKMFVYDFLDLCVTAGFLGLEDGHYVVPEGAETIDADVAVIKPRFTDHEDGWTNPWNVPEKVVPLKVCRELPVEDEVETESTESAPEAIVYDEDNGE